MNSSQTGVPDVFPDTPDCYSTNRIFEALAVLAEKMILNQAGYSENECKYIMGNFEVKTYFSLIEYLTNQYKFDYLTIKLILKLVRKNRIINSIF